MVRRMLQKVATAAVGIMGLVLQLLVRVVYAITNVVLVIAKQGYV